MNLFKAHRQWATRPSDERFNTVEDLIKVTRGYAKLSKQGVRPYSELTFEASKNGEEVLMVGKTGVNARFTHWAFGQTCARLAIPAEFARRCPTELAVQNLRVMRDQLLVEDPQAQAQLLMQVNGDNLLRAVTGEGYNRFWNYEIAERLAHLEDNGWRPASPTFNKQSNCQEAALYASDHDMFAFMMMDNVYMPQPWSWGKKTDKPLYRGLIYENSEVGDNKLKVTKMMMNGICGNFIIWDASDVASISLKHTKHLRDRLYEFEVFIEKYLNSDTSHEQEVMKHAAKTKIAADREEVLDALFGIRSVGLSRKVLANGYDANVPDEDGPANTAWGMAAGLTRYSQTVPYADERNRIDRAAGRILTLKF